MVNYKNGKYTSLLELLARVKYFLLKTAYTLYRVNWL
jgi:hypothetical protein